MGRRLGNALIIYGVVNFVVCCFLGPAAAFFGFLWLILFLLLGRWQRNKAKRQSRMVELARKGEEAEFEDAINRILDEREKDQKYR